MNLAEINKWFAYVNYGLNQQNVIYQVTMLLQ